MTATGFVAIEDISVGDLVWAENPTTASQELKKVVQTFISETRTLVHIRLGDEVITTTPEHPFYIPTIGWYSARYLHAGDILVKSNGEYVIIEKVQHEILEEPILVYNFEVVDFHTYYVGFQSVLVHNTCKPTSPVKLNNSAIKGIDMHGFKYDFVGSDYAKWDVFKDTANHSVLWIGNKSQNVWIQTGYTLEELIKLFPK